jgi:DNA mismatch endonuclease, patch repair protein
MPDFLTPHQRSERMSLIRSQNSKAELLVFEYLRRNKVYHQKHYKRVVGKPDIALPRKRRAVFIDGDYWHGRSYNKVLARYGTDGFWTNKIRENMQRDERQRKELTQHGWTILAVWESDINRKRTRDVALNSIRQFLLAS